MSSLQILLYSDLDRIPRHPILSWHEDLCHEFAVFQKNPEISAVSIKTLAAILNRLSLLCLYTNNFERASILCHQAIQYFSPLCLENPHFNQSVVFQPWINLIRMSRFLSQLDQTKELLRFLDPHLPSPNLEIQGYPFPKHQMHPECLSLIHNCFFDEKIKLFIRTNQYEALAEFLEEMSPLLAPHQKPLKEEALILSSHFLYGPEQALEQAHRVCQSIHRNYLPFFHLRIAQLYQNLQNEKQAHTFLQPLFTTLQPSIGSMNPSGLRFCLYVGKTLQECGLFEEATGFFQALLARHKVLNDELSTLEVLACLRHLPAYDKLFEETLRQSYYFFWTSAFRTELPPSPALELVEQLLSFFSSEPLQKRKKF